MTKTSIMVLADRQAKRPLAGTSEFGIAIENGLRRPIKPLKSKSRAFLAQIQVAGFPLTP
jgi:hypothetical protein